MKFGDKLSKLRRNKGLSQEELGYQLNVTRQTISKWELGQSKPDADKLKEISKFFDIDFNQLIDDEVFIEENSLKDNDDSEEVRPRKWLLILLIVVALILVIILANKYITDKKENSFNIFDIFGGFGDTIDYESMEKSSFNATFEMHSGTNLGNLVSSLIDDVITNNKTNNEHIIELAFNDINTIDPNEMKNIKNKINIFGTYEVSLDYDVNGYVNKITIEVSVSKLDVIRFNNSFEIYSGSNYGTTVDKVLDDVISSNKKNADRIITVIYGDIKTTDENQIRKIKKSLDDWTKYDVIFDYDDVGYINQITIEN